MADKPKEPEAQEGVDDVASQLRQLGQELVAVAGDSLARQAKLKEVENFLGKLRVADFPDLAESPVIQGFVKAFADAGSLKPGQVRNRGTLAEFGRDWTWDDACREFEHVTFTPAVSVPITWNGVGPVYVQALQECSLPKPFYDIYRNHMYALRMKDVHQRYMMGQSDAPPDPNWYTDHTAKLRAQAQLKGPTGQPGAFLVLGGGLIAPRAGGEGAAEGEGEAKEEAASAAS